MTEQKITMLQLRIAQVYPDSYNSIDTERPCRNGKIVKEWLLYIKGIVCESFESWADLEKYANHLIFVKSDEDLDPEFDEVKERADARFWRGKNRCIRLFGETEI